MKILGKNSVSQFISYIIIIAFSVSAFHLIYEIVGHLILLYKYSSGSKIFSDTFILRNDVGWALNQWTIPMQNDLKFRINYPFTDIQMVTGIYGTSQIFYNILGLIFITLFFFFALKCFNEISKEQIFNKNAVKWFKRFSILNLAFGLVGLFLFFYNNMIDGYSLYFYLPLLMFGVVIFFIVEFFKKGLELQQENDLTI